MAFLRLKKIVKIIGGKYSFLSPLFFCLIYTIGCVPSPSENINTSPVATDLHSYIKPQLTTRTDIWHFIPRSITGLKDSIYTIDYVGQINSKTSEGFSPVSHFMYLDSLQGDSVIRDAYISDSLVVWYYGKSSDVSTPSQILLKDTLHVGANWIASENFRTSNGVFVRIKALVEDYYPVSGNNYNDVYWVSYTSTVKGSQNPLEPEYQNGAHLSRYFAKGVGEYLERCLDSRDSLIWTSELTETRIR